MNVKISKTKPLSVNEAWRGKRFKTPKYLSYETEMLLLLPNKKKVSGYVEVVYRFGIPQRFDVIDVGNFEKLISDIIVKKGYIDDDSKIVRMVLEKRRTPEHEIEIEINQVAE